MKNSIPLKLITCACLVVFLNLIAQEAKEEPTFFTGLSPVILERNAAEINVINSLTSYWILSKQFRPDNPMGFFVFKKRFT